MLEALLAESLTLLESGQCNDIEAYSEPVVLDAARC